MSWMTRIKKLVGRALSDPAAFCEYLFPDRHWRRFDALARASGLERLHLVFSFDCDTVKDAEVVLGVDDRMRELGVSPAYAVPGEVLRGAKSVYRELADRGAEFINHGHVLHTLWHEDENRYESCFFYDELSADELGEDIGRGHETVAEVLGIEPVGFRAPHFGRVREEQLRLVHDVLKRLGYAFSSSTVPSYAFSHGPAFMDFGLPEIPVSGWWRQPFNIQDSWGYMAAPGSGLGAGDYLEHARETAEQLGQRQYAGVLNYYADPSQVYDKPEFFEAVRCWAEVAEPLTFGSLMERMGGLSESEPGGRGE